MILTTYKITLPATPYPFEGTATACTLKQAVAKIQRQARQCGCVKTSSKPVNVEILARTSK
jgi:hypothetical protein